MSSCWLMRWGERLERAASELLSPPGEHPSLDSLLLSRLMVWPLLLLLVSPLQLSRLALVLPL